MKYLVALLSFTLLTFSCYDDDDNRTAGNCYDAVKAGESFLLDDKNVTVLSLESSAVKFVIVSERRLPFYWWKGIPLGWGENFLVPPCCHRSENTRAVPLPWIF